MEAVSSLINSAATRSIDGTQSGAKAAEEFEAVFLSQFVDQMMKTAGDTAFGGTQQAEMWRSFMSDAVSKHLVEQGGLGLTRQVQEMLAAYGSTQTRGDGS